jgi:hypothetical protein
MRWPNFAVVLLGFNTPSPPPISGQCGSLSLLSLALFSLCVAGRACLSPADGRGGGGRTQIRQQQNDCVPLPVYIPFVSKVN